MEGVFLGLKGHPVGVPSKNARVKQNRPLKADSPGLLPSCVVLLILSSAVFAQPAGPDAPPAVPGAAPAAEAGPGKPAEGAAPGSEQPLAPVEPDLDTVLLRERWTPVEAGRVRGLAHRISRVLESPAEKVPLKDSAGRKFDMDYAGRIRFNPLDDNWKPLIPNVNEVAFHLAEAESLRRFGLKEEALSLWKSVRAMALFVKEPPAHVKKAAVAATQKINAMRNGDPDFHEIDRKTDPYIFYHERDDETMLISDYYGWRVRLPGRFRLARAKVAESQQRSRQFERNTVHLKQGPVILTVHSDLWGRGWKIPGVRDYARVWDFRRTLGPQRKREFGFTREPHPQSERCVPGRLKRELAPDGQAKCAVYQTVLERRGREFHFMEFFHVRPFTGFLLEVRFAPEFQSDADALLQEFLNRVVFSSR